MHKIEAQLIQQEIAELQEEIAQLRYENRLLRSALQIVENYTSTIGQLTADRTTCPDCQAQIPADGNCWYCENQPTPSKEPTP